MKTYLRTDYDGSRYLTAGILYPVVSGDGDFATIFDNYNDEIECHVPSCQHIDGNAWEVVDLDKPSTVPLIIIESIHRDEVQRQVAALDGYAVKSAQALPETATRAITYIVFMVRRF